MTFWELLNFARERYLAAYRETISEQRSQAPDLMAEAAVRPNGADHVPIDYQVFRVDFLWMENEQPRIGAVDTGPAESMAPLQINYPEGRQVVVHSFRWDECLVAVAPPLQSDGLVVDWLRQWRDRLDNPTPGADGLHEAVHSLTPPQLQAEYSVMLADFGSAPPEAVTGLIAALFASGARTIHITAPPPMPSATTNI